MEALYANWNTNLLVIVTTALTVALVVLIHYEGLIWLSGKLGRMKLLQRRKILYGIYVLLAIHVVEIWVFGLALWGLLKLSSAGYVVGMTAGSLVDTVYLSASTFTTVGFGDLAPVGAIRFLCGTEALAGLMLITWSASFMYIEMEKFWRKP